MIRPPFEDWRGVRGRFAVTRTGQAGQLFVDGDLKGSERIYSVTDDYEEAARDARERSAKGDYCVTIRDAQDFA